MGLPIDQSCSALFMQISPKEPVDQVLGNGLNLNFRGFRLSSLSTGEGHLTINPNKDMGELYGIFKSKCL
tara:strand:- start:348 stop:557 length:210 start_codon:yes stop_codon:yes gene_type:complete